MNRSFVRVAPLFSAAITISACHHAGTASTAASPMGATGGAAARASSAKPAAVTAASIALGDSLFHAKSCVRCHGADAKGAANGNGPDLTTTTHLHVNGSYDDFVRIITTGVPSDSIKVKTRRFAMQPRGGAQNPLTDDQIRAVAAYVYSLSHK